MIIVISVDYFQLSKKSQDKELVISLIELIKKTTKEFATPLKKNIKIIGLEDDRSVPRLILFDLIKDKPYLSEFNIFQIQINTSNYEVLANGERYVAKNIESIEEIIGKVINTYEQNKNM